MTRREYNQKQLKQQLEKAHGIGKLFIHIRLRKDTTPAHWAYGGLFVPGLTLAFGGLAGLVGLVGFGVWERWNDIDGHTHEGAMDFWEAFVMTCIAHSPIIVLKCMGILDNLSWLSGAFPI